MRRRAADEQVSRFRLRRARELAERIALPDWSVLRLDPDPAVPDDLGDRAADSWEPLLSIADAAGGDWPARARVAAVALSSEEDGQTSVGVRLLGDIQDVFGTDDHLTTSALLERLHELDSAPWGGWHGSPLTSRGLATLLTPHRIGPTQRRVKGEKSRGYFRSDFSDAWRRYVLPAPGTSGTSGTSGTEHGPVAEADDIPVEEDYPASAWDGDAEA